MKENSWNSHIVNRVQSYEKKMIYANIWLLFGIIFVQFIIVMRKFYMCLALVCASVTCFGESYSGRVVDENGRPISYATIYPKADPVAGTATNMDGYFSFTTTLPDYEDVIISFIGYEKVVKPLAYFNLYDTLVTVTLREQPIALEETVVAAKASRQRNKRKAIAQLLSQVYNQMESDFSKAPARYRIVSDVRMDSEGEAWGMEQMIATVVNLPEQAHNGRDSVQFHGEHCKRYFRPDLRQKADTILSSGILQTMDDGGKKDQKMNYQQAAHAVDSGVVVHRELWRMGNVLFDMSENINELKKWTVSNESEGETVLTHTDKHNYLGIFKMEFVRNYIVDSQTLSIRRFSEHAEFWVNIPFGYKLKADQLQLLNMLNMSSTEIEKFRLRKAHARITLNTIYQWQNDHIYPLEKNLQTDAQIIGTKNVEIPILVKATQRAIRLETENVKPMSKKELTNRLEREIVEIY